MQFVHVWPKPSVGGTEKEGEGPVEGAKHREHTGAQDRIPPSRFAVGTEPFVHL